MAHERRKCIYYDEDVSNMPLASRPQVFEHYTMIGCLFECRAKRVMKKCGCLPYTYPIESLGGHETHCNVRGLQCLADEYGK